MAGLHTPAAWHGGAGAQATGAPPVQTPAWQVSMSVHGFPSLHGVLCCGMLEQSPVAGLHEPTSWQAEAWHTMGAPPRQMPLWQASLSVQGLPSLQEVPLGWSTTEHSPVLGWQIPA